MRTSDIFVTTAEKLNESIGKVFGKKLNLESFDLPKLQDARNKLRTQLSQVRNESGFNETLENEAYTEAQWMLDAINAEIAERTEFIVDPVQNEDYESFEVEGSDDPADKGEYDREGDMAQDDLSTAEEAAEELKSILDADENLPEWVQAKITKAVDYLDTARDYMKSNEEIQTELSTNTLKSYQDKAGKDIANTMTSGDHMTTDKSVKKVMNRMKGSEKADNKIWKKNESINTGDNMRKLNEGEIQQASAIVTAKTMVDRVGRWIEELSGMENDTLLTLGDSIRDEMGAEQAKNFISACAPAIQQALQNLKDTREALSTSVRALTGEEQATDMLGGEPAPDAGGEMGGDEFGGEAEPDAMNPEAGVDDEFAAAEPAAGGMNDAGREKRESIDFSNRLLKVLAG